MRAGVVDLVLSLGVGVGAGAYAVELYCRTLRAHTASIVAAARPRRGGAVALSFDEVYAAPPSPQPNQLYATFAQGWNAAVGSLRKVVADIFVRPPPGGASSSS
mmetsp:Transcript_36495/g.116985  ORF Transcript_36495/g.116985 Transcript_36495/m.116985 type:complete len:104 (-) Transcript_36495:772-1083(-)